MSTQPKSLRELSLIQLSFPDIERLRTIAQFVPERDAVAHAELEDNLRAIARRFERFQLKGRTLDLYTNNRIHLLVNKETVVVPTLLPAWRVAGAAAHSGVQAFVNAVPYLPAMGAAAIDIRRLYGLLTFGAVLVDVYDHWGKMTASMPLAKAGAAVYARMMHKVVDRITGVGMDRMRSDQVKYAFAKYFLVNMLQRVPNETADSIAGSVTAGSANNALADFESALAAAAKVGTQQELYDMGFVHFVDALSGAAPWLNRLTSRSFLQTYTSLYDPPALLAAEEAGYFLATLAAHQAGAELVKSFSFDPVYGKEGDEALDEVARLAR